MEVLHNLDAFLNTRAYDVSMVGCYYLLLLQITVLGAILGFIMGQKYFGPFGALVGIVVGAWLAARLYTLPRKIAAQRALKRIQGMSSEMLMEEIRGDHPATLALALTELTSRGCDCSEALPHIFKCLDSPQLGIRGCGFSAIQVLFPNDPRLKVSFYAIVNHPEWLVFVEQLRVGLAI